MAETAERGDSDLRTFYIHLVIFVAANLVLAGINLWQAPDGDAPRTYWFVWPLAGWSIGILAHGLALWLKRLGADESSLFADKDVRGAAVHLFVYLAVNTLLIVVNFVVTPNTIWFFWPLIGWGFGLAFHAWHVYRAVLRRTVEHYALEQRLIGEISLERRASEIAASIIPGMAKPDEKEETAKTAEAKTLPKKRTTASPGKSTKVKSRKAASGKQSGATPGSRKKASKRKSGSSSRKTG